MATIENIQDAYIDYVLTKGEEPKSVYVFAKENNLTEEEFYRFFGSFEAVEQSIWADIANKTIAGIKTQEVWPQYSAREKALSFFYSFFELLKSKRSFAVYSIRKHPAVLSHPRVLNQLKPIVESFADDIIKQGLESGELADRRFLSKRYKDGFCMQFGFVLNFWIDDNSAGFEKTDEAIEKGVNVTFDLFERSPLDNLLEYGKFLARNGNFRQKMGV